MALCPCVLITMTFALPARLAFCGTTGQLKFEFPFLEFLPQIQPISFSAYVSLVWGQGNWCMVVWGQGNWCMEVWDKGGMGAWELVHGGMEHGNWCMQKQDRCIVHTITVFHHAITL